MHQGQLTGAVFIDLRKAFDTVDHSLLLRQLSTLGVTGQAHDWFKDYLGSRTQVVGFRGVLSDSEPVNVGVPAQGSILGLLLFVLPVNDLPDVVIPCSILMYTGDTVLFFSSKQVAEIEQRINEELDLISPWLRANKLF